MSYSTEQFNSDEIGKLGGSPWEPVPGRESMRIPTNAEESGGILDDDSLIEGHAEEMRRTRINLK